LALVLVLTLGLVTAVPVAAADITVSGDESIQVAIVAAGVGGTITVDATYTGAGDTFPIIVDVADLTIQGAAGAIINGGGTDWVPAVKITATGVTLQGFTIQNFKADASNDWGAVFVQGNGATIQGNTIHAIGDTEPEPFGIGIDVASNNVDVIGNTVYDTGSIGIRVYGPFGGTTTGVLVENNVVYHTGNTGVVFANTVSNSTIRGNHLYDSLDPTPYNLFLCWGFDKEGPPNNILIEGNTISGGYGNIVLAGAEYITITGNTITGAVPLATNGKNIYILDDYLQGTNHLSTNIVITNNDILGAEGYGVRIKYTGAVPEEGAFMASTTTINNNNIYGNTDFGVENTIETIVNATNNWWGSASGPTHADNTFNVGDQGDVVSDYVDYVPWLDAASPAGASFAPVALDGDADYSSIQSAIDAAIAGDTISVDAGTYNEDITLVNGIQVLGAGEASTTINGTGTGSVVTASGAGPTTKLDGFTITGGNTPASGGGGMYIDNSSLTVSNCTFSGNTAPVAGMPAGLGGGMHNANNSSPTITNCTFSGNSANQGGGGMCNSNSSPTVTDCTFFDNSTRFGGAGMANRNSSPTITDCTFYNNTGNYVGGMSNYDSPATVTNCTF